MRRRELLGFELSWPGCCLSSQVIKKEEKPKGTIRGEACNDGSSLAVPVDFSFLSMTIFAPTHPIYPPPNGMSGKRGRDKKKLERANIINFILNPV